MHVEDRAEDVEPVTDNHALTMLMVQLRVAKYHLLEKISTKIGTKKYRRYQRTCPTAVWLEVCQMGEQHATIQRRTSSARGLEGQESQQGACRERLRA